MESWFARLRRRVTTLYVSATRCGARSGAVLPDRYASTTLVYVAALVHSSRDALRCKFANSAPCAQQTMKVKTEFSIATRISSLVAVGEQVWGACQDRKIRIWSAKVHWH